ncbi:MAG: hypothetical protein KME31_15400 [Tolypothrix carrinoi HA7290-LM1]|nr:hypothetical protein [Tolypothrix carrinoi HA7290-LM1]
MRSVSDRRSNLNVLIASFRYPSFAMTFVAVPKLTGAVPQLMGAVPQLTGTVPQLTGTVPQLTGTVPELRGTIPQLMGTIPQLTGTVSQLTGVVPELMGTVYLATLVTNTQFVSTHYLTLMTVNGKACHNYCRETKIPKI